MREVIYIFKYLCKRPAKMCITYTADIYYYIITVFYYAKTWLFPCTQRCCPLLQRFEFPHTAFFMWLVDPDYWQLICFHKTIEIPSNMIDIQSNTEHYYFVSKSLERPRNPWFAFKTPHFSKFLFWTLLWCFELYCFELYEPLNFTNSRLSKSFLPARFSRA